MQELRGQMATGNLPSLCRDSFSCPVVQAALAEEKRLPPESVILQSASPVELIAARPPELRLIVPKKRNLLNRVVRGLRKRFNLELDHSLGEWLDRQEEINRALTEEIKRLRADVAKLKGKPEKSGD